MRLIPRKCNVTSLPTFFDDFFTRELTRSEFGSQIPSYPKINVYEDTQAYHIEMAAPGWTKDQIQLSMQNEVLTIESNIQKEEEEGKSGETYYRKEFMSSSFTRSFRVPKEMIDIEKIHAEFENGILEVSLPKKEGVEHEPSRIIDIE